MPRLSHNALLSSHGLSMLYIIHRNKHPSQFVVYAVQPRVSRRGEEQVRKKSKRNQFADKLEARGRGVENKAAGSTQRI